MEQVKKTTQDWIQGNTEKAHKHTPAVPTHVCVPQLSKMRTARTVQCKGRFPTEQKMMAFLKFQNWGKSQYLVIYTEKKSLEPSKTNHWKQFVACDWFQKSRSNQSLDCSILSRGPGNTETSLTFDRYSTSTWQDNYMEAGLGDLTMAVLPLGTGVEVEFDVVLV